MNGYRTLGRCTLIEPIEWTVDGWFRAAERWPPSWETPAVAEMPVSDAFDGQRLGIQWQFYRRYDPSRYRLAGGRLTLEGFGDSPGRSQPLSIMAMHRAYEIETEVTLDGDGSAGLMLFGSPEVYIGLAIGSDGTLRRVQEGFRRYGRTDEPVLDARRVTLRIVNDKQDVRFHYRLGDSDWQVLQPGMDVSSMTTVGWHALRPALFTIGNARGIFERFDYRILEE
jgi:xylan 1,4-beta-xylosidase